MVDVIKALAPHFALAVMSSNSMDTIRRILESAGVAQCFAHVFSAEVGASKQLHLQRVRDDPAYGGVRQCSPAYLETVADDQPGQGSGAARGAVGVRAALPGGDVEVVLITDTVGDIAEAKASGTRAIGVAWGMHSSAALLRAGAERVVNWPQEIIALLLPDGRPPVGACACAADGSCTVTGSSTVPARVAQPATGTEVAAPPRPGAARPPHQRDRSSRPAPTEACRRVDAAAVAASPTACTRAVSRGAGTAIAAQSRHGPPEGQLVAAIARIARRPP